MNESARIELPSLGDQQLDALRFISDHAPITVGEMAKEYGTPRNLARTTILTVMERLRTKGFLTRRKVAGIYYYSPKNNHEEVMNGVVSDFIHRTLGGSMSPFVNYLAETGKLSQTEIHELRRMVEIIEADAIEQEESKS